MIVEMDLENRQEILFTVPSDYGEIQSSVEKICKYLDGYRSDSGFYSFALSEMLANAMEHGNQMIPDKFVTVEVIRYECHYKVIITDEGQGFDWMSRYNLELDLTGESDRGRGIIMSKMMCNGLVYNREGNQVTIIVSIDKQVLNKYDSNSKYSNTSASNYKCLL